MRDLIIKHRIFFGIIILLIVLTIPLTVIQVQQQQTLKQRASGTDVSILLAPPSKTLSIGDELSTTIKIDNPSGESITAATITLNYPTDLLDYKDGSFNPDEGFSLAGNLDNTGGAFKFTVIQESNSDPTLTTNRSINVVTLRFIALKNGSAKIEFLPPEITAQGHGTTPLTVTLPAVGGNTYTISAAQRSDTASSSPTKYPLCWGGSPTVNALSGCELNITEGASCSSGYNKCLSVDRISGAEEIDGKYLTCCNASEYGLTGNDECTLVADGEFSDPKCSVPITAATPTLTIGSDPNSPNKNILNFSFGKFGPDETVTIKYDNTRSATVTADSDGAGAGSIWIPAVGSYTLTATGGGSPTKNATAETTVGAGRIDHSTEGYVPCGTGLQCKSNKAKNPCGQSYDKKCLARDDSNVWIGADTIGDKYLVCCSDDSKAASYDLVDDICTLTEPSADNYIANACTPPNPPKDDPYHATLTINSPTTITEKGSLSYKFTGFQPGNVDVWVERSTSGTAYIIKKTADASGKGDGIISNLSESAGNYTLWAKGSNSISVPADFTIIAAAASALDPLALTACSTLVGPELNYDNVNYNEISWKPVDGATGYNVRINSDPLGDWKNDCTVSQFPGDVCENNVFAGTSEQYTFEAGKISRRYNFAPGTNYTFAVHTVNDACREGGQASQISVSRPAPGDTIIRLPAGAFSKLFTTRRKAVNEQIAHKNKSLTIYLYNSTKDTKAGVADYSVQSATELSSSEENVLEFNLGNNVTPGTYKILLKNQKYLRTLVKTMSITVGINAIETLDRSLADGAGDVNDDNVIDILDYNIIIGCHGDKADTSSCTNKEGADLNDDEKVDQLDYNIYMTTRGFKDGD